MAVDEPVAGVRNDRGDNASPPVSVLVRSMDRPTLTRALDSIAAQTWANLEIVVAAACGHRHRRLGDEWKGRPLRLVFAEADNTLTRPQAANLALDHARGEWLNFLDDDDEFLPDHLQTLLDTKRNDGARVIYSRSRVVDDDGRDTGEVGFAGMHVQLFYQSRSTPASTLFARSLVDEGARFDEAFERIEDHDFFVNLATRSPFHFVDEATTIWHAHAGESGAGFGRNERLDELAPLYAQLREKWQAEFTEWNRDDASLLFLGQHALRNGDHELAREYLENALNTRPNDVNALNLCGMANLHTGRFARAESLMLAALVKLPTHRGLQDNLALIRERARAPEAAAGAPRAQP